MAEDSVGKVSLDLEIEASDIGAQLEAMGKKIGIGVEKSIKSALGKAGAEKILKGISSAFQKTMDIVGNSINKTLEQCLEAAKEKVDVLGQYMADAIDKAMSRFTKVPPPAPPDGVDAALNEAKTNIAQPRAPPGIKFKTPTIKIDYTREMMEEQSEQVEAVINSLGKQIDLQEKKLDSLKAAYDRTFNEPKKGKMQEQIIKTEGSILSLQGKIQALGVQWDALGEKILSMAEDAKKVEISAPKLSAPRIGSLGGRAVKLPELYTTPSTKNVKRLDKAIENLGYTAGVTKNRLVKMSQEVNVKPGIESVKALSEAIDQAGTAAQATAPRIEALNGPELKISGANDANISAAERILKLFRLPDTIPARSAVADLSESVEDLAEKTEEKLEPAAKKANKVTGRLFKTLRYGASKALKAGSALLKFGSRAKKAGRQSSEAQSAMKRMLTTMLRYRIIIPVIMGLLRNMSRSLFASMNANDQFRNSLKQIRSNLSVAFTPIYQTIMPAVNALMSALARLTGYFAAFTSMLFGKTLSASVNATKGLVAAKDAMGAYGSAAKKAAKDAKGATTSLDELNILQDKKDAGGGGGGGAPEIIPPKIDTTQMGIIDAMTQKVRDTLSQLFKPLKDSWDSEGQNVINAAQSAFSSIVGLAGAMKDSFMDVWTNGTGEQFCTNILQLVTLIFDIVGDVADAFKRAWNEGERGTNFIQSIFDLLNASLSLIHTIGESFRDVWNSGIGESVIGHILGSLTNVNKTITNIQKNFQNAWKLDDTGTKIIKNLADTFDGLLGSVEKITKSLSNWSAKLNLAPILTSFERLTKALKPLGDKLGKGLEWMFEKVLEPLAGWAIENGIPAVIDLITSAFGTLNAVLDVLKPIGEWLWDKLLEPLAKWTGGKFVEGIKDITDVFNDLTKVLEDITNGDWDKVGKDLWDGLVGGVRKWAGFNIGIIGDIFFGAPKHVKKILGINSPSTVFAEIGENTMKGYKTGVESEKPGLMGGLQSLVDGIKEKFNAGYDKITSVFTPIGGWFEERWNDVKSGMLGAPDWFSEKFTSARTKVTDAFQDVGTWFGDRYTDTTNAFQNTPDWFKNTFHSAYDNLTAVVQPIGGWFEARYKDVQDSFQNIPYWFQDTFHGAYDKLTDVVQPIGSWFEERYTDVTNAFKESPEWFQSTFTSVTDNVRDIFSGLIDFINGVFSGDWKKAWDGVKDVFKGVFNSVVTLLENAMNSIVSGINKVLDGLNKVAGAVGDVIGLDLKIPRLDSVKIPRLASGGYVGANQPRLAMIGDNRRYGEIVAPEDKMQAMVDKAVALAARPDGMSERYLSVMIDLLKKIIELIENLDLTVNFDTREIKKKLVELEKRSGYNLNPT